MALTYVGVILLYLNLFIFVHIGQVNNSIILTFFATNCHKLNAFLTYSNPIIEFPF